MSGKISTGNTLPTVALVLSSGGSRGLAHIGVIEALKEHGFQITSVAGSSIGALIGGLYAMGKLDDYKEWVCTLNKKDVWELIDFAFSTKGLLKGKRVFERMQTFIPDARIEDFRIPFAAVAADLINQRQVVFRSGSFYHAVRASIAIPAIFTPVQTNDTILVDGGIINPLPISVVQRTSGDIVVAVNLYAQSDNGYRPIMQNTTQTEQSKNYLYRLFSKLVHHGDVKSPGYYTLLHLSISTLIQQLTFQTIEYYKPDIVIHIPAQLASVFDFHRAKELIEYGKNITRHILHSIF